MREVKLVHFPNFRDEILKKMHPLEDEHETETYSHQPFRKENDLNQTSMIMFQP